MTPLFPRLGAFALFVAISLPLHAQGGASLPLDPLHRADPRAPLFAGIEVKVMSSVVSTVDEAPPPTPGLMVNAHYDAWELEVGQTPRGFGAELFFRPLDRGFVPAFSVGYLTSTYARPDLVGTDSAEVPQRTFFVGYRAYYMPEKESCFRFSAALGHSSTSTGHSSTYLNLSFGPVMGFRLGNVPVRIGVLANAGTTEFSFPTTDVLAAFLTSFVSIGYEVSP